MSGEVILSLLYSQQGFTDDAMKGHRVESPESREMWDRLDSLLTPLEGEALELAAEYGAAKERDGFLNGFRLAVRLLMDCARENPAPAETRPGA